VADDRFRRPKFPRTHPGYQGDFENAVGPAFKSLMIVPVSAGWAPATVAKGLLDLARAQVQGLAAHIESDRQLHKPASPDGACRAADCHRKRLGAVSLVDR
jgi:hypothetical protein